MSTTTTAPAPVASTTLSVEIAALDGIKQSLASGDPAEALRELDAYRATFPGGKLSTEAGALRIEALVRSGRRDEARAELARFKADHPESPLLNALGPMVGAK
jgi:outer membrane protein assembly factor BamD (BamD/ComL family)